MVEGEFGDTEEFLSLVKAAQPGDYNVFLVSGVYDYARFCKAGFGDAINEANIPNLAKCSAGDPEAFRSRSEGKLSAVPFDYGVTGLAYNRKYISDEEAKAQGVKLQFDREVQGQDRRSMTASRPASGCRACISARIRRAPPTSTAIWDAAAQAA